MMEKIKQLEYEEKKKKRFTNSLTQCPPMHILEPTLVFHPIENNLVADARVAEEEAKACNPWTDIEKVIFIDKFLQYPKDFRKIGSYLVNKDTADCICFYYGSKKHINYKALLRCVVR